MRTAILAAIALMAFCHPATQAYAEEPDRLVALKAAYIFNIARFTYWGHDDKDLVLCLASTAAHYRSAFLSLESKRKGKSGLKVRQLSGHTGLPGCDILYLAGNRTSDSGDPAPSQAGLLTIADENVSGAGSIIEFSVVENRLRFSVDLVAASNAGLKMSSKLLALAYEVRRSDLAQRPSS